MKLTEGLIYYALVTNYIEKLPEKLVLTERFGMTNLGVKIEGEDDREAGGKRALLKMLSFLLFTTG